MEISLSLKIASIQQDGLFESITQIIVQKNLEEET